MYVYTSTNYESITSEEYLDKVIEMGAWFIRYFHYMPENWKPVADKLWENSPRKENYQ